MKGTVCTVVVLLAAVSSSLAAVGIGRATVHESHPNQCYEAKSASYYSPGDSWPMEGVCGKVTCEKMSSSSPLMISFATCGVVGVNPPCYLVQDMTKPYPGCCHQIVCPETSEEDSFVIPEANNVSPSNETSQSSSAEGNDVAGTAMHFSLGRTNNNFVNGGERNDLQSLEDEDSQTSEESFEIIQPRMLPPTFQYATFDDIDNDHEQRFNEVDAQGEYKLV